MLTGVIWNPYKFFLTCGGVIWNVVAFKVSKVFLLSPCLWYNLRWHINEFNCVSVSPCLWLPHAKTTCFGVSNNPRYVWAWLRTPPYGNQYKYWWYKLGTCESKVPLLLPWLRASHSKSVFDSKQSSKCVLFGVPNFSFFEKPLNVV